MKMKFKRRRFGRTTMKTINKQLDEELFGNYYILRLHPRLRPRPHPHPHLLLLLHLLPRLYFSDKVFNQLDNLYIDWEYGNSVLEMI